MKILVTDQDLTLFNAKVFQTSFPVSDSGRFRTTAKSQYGRLFPIEI